MPGHDGTAGASAWHWHDLSRVRRQQTVVSYNATTFYDRDRTLQGVFAAARDVTERNRLDQVAAGKERRAGERQVRGGTSEPRQIGFPVQHEP